ncbi:MAG TPA: hypothetical protein VGF84_02235 [Micromonosporaceae bacterium]
MKKPSAIYGIGWTQEPSADPGRDRVVTLSHVGAADEDVAVALGTAVGHAPGTDGSYAVAPETLAALPAGEVADLLADMVEDGLDIVIAFSVGRMSDDQLVQLLRDVYDSGRAEVVYGEAHWWPTEDPATDPYPLIERWAKVWPDSLPIAHELKELFEDQWVRFHSLPGSKRAPESESDWAVALDRHNAVLGELAAGDDDLLVIMSVVAPAPAPAYRDDGYRDDGYRDDEYGDDEFWTSVPWHYADPDLLFAHLYVTGEQWAPGALDELLRLAIEQQIGGVIIAPLELGWLYHPYPGGADVIMASRGERAALAARYADWRSTHPSGL